MEKDAADVAEGKIARKKDAEYTKKVRETVNPKYKGYYDYDRSNWGEGDPRPSFYGKKAMLGRELEKLVKDRRPIQTKPSRFKDGGAVSVQERSVHKSAGDPVTVYQASNSNYKEGK